MCKRVSVYVSECVCLLYPLFFSSSFLVLVNDLSLVFRFFVLEMRTISFLFLLPFISFCCMRLYFMFIAVSYQMFFHVLGFLK